MYLLSKGEDTWQHTLSEEGLCVLWELPFALQNAHRRTPAVKSGGEGVQGDFCRKSEKSSKTWSVQKLYLQILREMDFGLWHGISPRPQVPTVLSNALTMSYVAAWFQALMKNGKMHHVLTR